MNNNDDSGRVITKTSARYKGGLIDQIEIEITIDRPLQRGNSYWDYKDVTKENLKESLSDLAIALEGINLKIGMSTVPVERFLNEKIEKL